MEYPHLRSALDASCYAIQSLLKQLVPVDSGDLRDSIVVEATIDNTSVKMVIELMYYYKYIGYGRFHKNPAEPVPVDEILKLSPTIQIQRYKSLNGVLQAIKEALNDAFKQDLIDSLK